MLNCITTSTWMKRSELIGCGENIATAAKFLLIIHLTISFSEEWSEKSQEKWLMDDHRELQSITVNLWIYENTCVAKEAKKSCSWYSLRSHFRKIFDSYSKSFEVVQFSKNRKNRALLQHLYLAPAVDEARIKEKRGWQLYFVPHYLMLVLLSTFVLFQKWWFL